MLAQMAGQRLQRRFGLHSDSASVSALASPSVSPRSPIGLPLEASQQRLQRRFGRDCRRGLQRLLGKG